MIRINPVRSAEVINVAAAAVVVVVDVVVVVVVVVVAAAPAAPAVAAAPLINSLAVAADWTGDSRSID